MSTEPADGSANPRIILHPVIRGFALLSVGIIFLNDCRSNHLGRNHARVNTDAATCTSCVGGQESIGRESIVFFRKERIAASTWRRMR